MAISMSFSGFMGFITRPFTNWMGWVLLIGAGVIIYLRVSGKIGGFGKGGRDSGSGQVDYKL